MIQERRELCGAKSRPHNVSYRQNTEPPPSRLKSSGTQRFGPHSGASQRLQPQTVADEEVDMTADLTVSLSVLAGVVAVCEATRRLLSRALARTSLCVCAVELVSTFQLCCCTHELKLLSEVGGMEPSVALTLTYLAAVVHGLTFGGAIGNPCGALERAYRSTISGWCALRRISCQFAAAVAARSAVPVIWGMGLSELHVRHKLFGYNCISSIRAPPPTAATVELACAFAVQTVITHTQWMEEKYRVHAVAAAITSAVYAGGHVTGAVFNPALAFSTQFPCGGSSFVELCVVYWLGPLLGMMSSVLLFDQLVPLLPREPQHQHQVKKTT